MSKVHEFVHEGGVKAGCCNYNTTRTYWMAETREEAENEIEDHTGDDREAHGNCASCFAQLITNGDYEVQKQ